MEGLNKYNKSQIMCYLTARLLQNSVGLLHLLHQAVQLGGGLGHRLDAQTTEKGKRYIRNVAFETMNNFPTPHLYLCSWLMIAAACCVRCCTCLGGGAGGRGTRSMETLDWPSMRMGKGVPALAPPRGVPCLGVAALGAGSLVRGVAGRTARTPPGSLGCGAAVAGEEGGLTILDYEYQGCGK